MGIVGDDDGIGFWSAVSDRGGIDVADREGPNFEATRALLSKNFLYSYLAKKNRHEPLRKVRKQDVTSNVLLEFTIPLIFGKHRWRRVS